tara:strand:+ start:139 stop:456 length:318 start_codon:yes stop_codon:yes gene_type:complete
MVIRLSSVTSNGDWVDSPRPIRKKEKSKETVILVEVSWIDSFTDGGWNEYAPETIETKTYGLLVKKTKDWVTLAMTKEKGYWGNLWYIPNKNVTNIRPIEEIQST